MYRTTKPGACKRSSNTCATFCIEGNAARPRSHNPGPKKFTCSCGRAKLKGACQRVRMRHSCYRKLWWQCLIFRKFSDIRSAKLVIASYRSVALELPLPGAQHCLGRWHVLQLQRTLLQFPLQLQFPVVLSSPQLLKLIPHAPQLQLQQGFAVEAVVGVGQNSGVVVRKALLGIAAAVRSGDGTVRNSAAYCSRRGLTVLSQLVSCTSCACIAWCQDC